MRALQRFCMACGLMALMAGVAGCGSAERRQSAQDEGKGAIQAQKEQLERLIVTRLNELQAQVAEQNKKLADMQVQHDRQVTEAIAANQALSEKLNQLKSIVQTGQVPSPPVVLPPAEKSQPAPGKGPQESYRIGGFLFRIIVLLVVLGVIAFCVFKFMGRWEEGEEPEAEDEDEEGFVSEEDEAAGEGNGRAGPTPTR